NPDAGRLGRLSAAQGLPARRDPGGVQGRRDSAARPAEGVLMTEKTTHGAQRLSDVTTGTDTTERGSTSDPYAPSRETTEGRVYTVTGGDWDEVMADVSGDEKIIMNLGRQIGRASCRDREECTSAVDTLSEQRSSERTT